MKKQPAKVNYFFKGGYIELTNTIKSSYRKLKDNLIDVALEVKKNFGDFWGDF